MLVCDIYTVFRRLANTWAAPSEYAHNGQIQINPAHLGICCLFTRFRIARPTSYLLKQVNAQDRPQSGNTVFPRHRIKRNEKKNITKHTEEFKYLKSSTYQQRKYVFLRHLPKKLPSPAFSVIPQRNPISR